MDWGKARGNLARVARGGATAAACLALAHCSSSDKFSSRVDPRYGVSSSPRVVEWGEDVPKGGGTYRVGKPYTVAGRTYVPEEDVNYRAEGLASWYGPDFHGRQTANGEVFDMRSLTAAHPTLPLPSYVRVTNVANGRSIILRVNDRGPYHQNRLIDVSIKAADMLGFQSNGVARVRVEYVSRAPLEGSDDGVLMATLRSDGHPAPAPSGIMLAASRPFLPMVRDRMPGAIPMPPDRPFTLGDGQPSAPSFRAGSDRSSAYRPGNPQVDSASLPATGDSRSMPTMSAYAPARQEPTSVMSGRGLY